MLITILLSTLLPILILGAEIPPSTSLSSSHAAYDGNALILTGKVQLDHGLGQMQAEHASLQKQEAGSDFPFALIELQKSVLLHLKNKGTLACSAAHLDFTLLKGVLSSDEMTPVIFSDTVNKNIPVKITSNHADLTFLKTSKDAKKSDYEIETILATDQVILEYNTAFILNADQVLYKNQGLISAYPHERGALCRLTHEQDLIDSSIIDIDLLQGQISMIEPIGSLASSLFPRVNQGALQFQSERLLWDQKRDMLVLKGKAHIAEEAIGDLSTENELRLVYTQKDKKRFLKNIQTKGKTVMHYGARTLTSYGPILLDREALTVAISSPVSENAVPIDKQICFQEGNIEIYSDKAQMEYSLFEGFIHPVSILLKDHVRLFSENAAHKKRWALADRLTYSPTTETFILTATPGKKVLFQNEEDGMTISAQEVHITYNPETKQEKIQGVGSVQLKFNTEEINQLKKMFTGYEPE